MRDEIFGEEPAQERAASQIKIIWPTRIINQIEQELDAAMGEALSIVENRAPVIWIEDDEFANAADYGGLSARDALTLQNIVRGEVIEQYRRQLIIARECGEHATVADYLAACAAEGINPLSERLTK
jgi:hypothetical protein